ncbi:MAG: hypothetical protein GSR78_00895, partial [Desulfurococcales archaeon]|nr:hypothetical protein [Desulfurococcales archaeon]
VATIKLRGKRVSAIEAARVLRDLNREMQRLLQEIEASGNLKVLTLTRTWARYWMYVLTLPPGNWPEYYSIDSVDNTLIIRFSKDKKPGYKKVVKRGGSKQITIPTRLLKKLGEVEPGPVLAEIVDERTIIVYLG